MKQQFKRVVKKQSMRTLNYVWVLSLSLYCKTAWAADPKEVAQNVLDYLTGDIAKVIAAICFVVVGFLSMALGKLHKGWLVGVVVGIALIFGADYLVNMAWGGG